MIMRFNKEEIEVIVKQHVLDQWNVPEGSVGTVEVRVDRNPKITDGVIVWVDVHVSTNDKDGGGPYRTAGK